MRLFDVSFEDVVKQDKFRARLVVGPIVGPVLASHHGDAIRCWLGDRVTAWMEARPLWLSGTWLERLPASLAAALPSARASAQPRTAAACATAADSPP